MTIKTAMAETTPPSPSSYRAFDWKVVFTVDGRNHEGATGRTDSADRARGRVAQELNKLPAGISAYGIVTAIFLHDTALPDAPAFIARRERGGTIRWTDRYNARAAAAQSLTTKADGS